jgi:hypothetical protein
MGSNSRTVRDDLSHWKAVAETHARETQRHIEELGKLDELDDLDEFVRRTNLVAEIRAEVIIEREEHVSQAAYWQGISRSPEKA